MIPAFVRTLFVVLLVCLVVFIVVSPYIDLPLTTLPGKQLILLALLALCLTPVSLVQRSPIPEPLRANSSVTDSSGAHMPPLFRALLC